jgi:hypothetical protein
LLISAHSILRFSELSPVPDSLWSSEKARSTLRLLLLNSVKRIRFSWERGLFLVLIFYKFSIDINWIWLKSNLKILVLCFGKKKTTGGNKFESNLLCDFKRSYNEKWSATFYPYIFSPHQLFTGFALWNERLRMTQDLKIRLMEGVQWESIASLELNMTCKPIPNLTFRIIFKTRWIIIFHWKKFHTLRNNNILFKFQIQLDRQITKKFRFPLYQSFPIPKENYEKTKRNWRKWSFVLFYRIEI